MRRLGSVVALILMAMPASAADHVKVGTTRLIGYVSVPVGLAQGYFQAEGIDVEQVYFESAQPIAVAAASGDVDFGVAGPSAGFYNLAAQGQVKLIGASGGDSKGFHALEFLASNKAWDAGLKTPHDLPGHSVAITQLGTALHNVIGILAERDGFPMSAVEVKPLQSNSTVISALIGGTVDASVAPNGPILNLVEKGQIKFLGWTSDYAPLKAGVMLLAANGHAIARVARVPAHTVEVRGVRRAPDAGELLAPPDAAGVVGQLPAALAQRVAAVDVSGDGIALDTVGNGEIRLGDTTGLASKSASALAVLGSLGDAHFAYIDVSIPSRPIVARTAPTISAGGAASAP